MSEYQCYEFLALDRPLTPAEIDELRAISSRAEITPARLWAEYNYGDFRGEPEELVARYFDAHNYFANWGTRRLMLRLPARAIDDEPLLTYFDGLDDEVASATRRGDYVIFDLCAQLEEPELDADEVSLDLLAPIRLELMRGDRRFAYLGWLLAVQFSEIDGAAREPPVPPGLGRLSPALDAMIAFLGLDRDLVEAAAEASAPMMHDASAFSAWVRALSPRAKDDWLLRAAEEPDLALGGQLLRAFRASHAIGASRDRRTVLALRTRAEEIAQARLRTETLRRQQAKQAAQRAKVAAFTSLTKREGGAWSELEALIAKGEYLEALKITSELHELALHRQSKDDFEKRLDDLKKRHPTRRGFFVRWSRQRRLRDEA